MVDYSELGSRLRELRMRRKWTLERAAAVAHLTASTLSRIETHRRIPSLEQLVALCSAYDITLGDLLPPAIGDPRIRSTIRRINGMAVRTISPPNSSLSVLEITLHKRTRRNKPQVHAGREWLYIVSGTAALSLGETELTLRAGEAVEFDTRIPHALNAESNNATLLAIYSEEGRRVHLRTPAL